MVESHKPRHIRDIAHLYISRLQSQSRALRTALLIAGENKDCFPGFHTANLAAALVSKGLTVRIIELSGLLPNSGFYMSLPGERYIQWREDENGSVFPGLAGVKVGFSLRARIGLQSASVRPRIELFHLPPASLWKSFNESFENVKSSVGMPVVTLLLGMGDNLLKGTELLVDKQLAPWPACILNLGKRLTPPYSVDRRFSDLGTLPDWKSALKDRVPAVIRVPNSALSNAYLSICESLLCRIHQFRRKSGAVPAFSVSPGIRSG